MRHFQVTDPIPAASVIAGVLHVGEGTRGGPVALDLVALDIWESDLDALKHTQPSTMEFVQKVSIIERPVLSLRDTGALETMVERKYF